VVELQDNSVRNLHVSDYNIPTALMGGNQDFAYSPSGDEICLVMSVDSAPALAVDNNIYVMNSDNDGPVRISDNPGIDVTPRYSPDGRFITFQSMARAGYESDQRDLVLYDRKQKMYTNIAVEFDRSIGEYAWDGKSKYIYFTAIEYGLSKVWRIEIASKNVELLLGDAVYDDLRLSPDGKYILVNRSLSDEPYELYRYEIKSREMRRLTHFTKAITADLGMSRAEDFWFMGALDDSVHGFLTLPPDFDPAGKYPLALLIHGGPQWCWLGDFNYYGWSTQLMAAQGYVVAQIDPHGSVGYGIKFKEYVSGHWGLGDYEDLMMGVDYLIEAHPFIDSTRMAALGRSYGGFMANWICGHTDRFKCLVSIDGTFNHLSEYGSTEELWFPEWEFNGTPYNNRDEYIRSSPLTYASEFRTPTMIIHGQKDYRVDLSEALQMFTALQRQSVPSQLLYFPDEGHSVRKLINLRYVYERQFEWLESWLR
jgi:dipeptidyl aminopeptidase/acylaminoacyl peptidase